MQSLIASIRLTIITLLLLSGGYTLVVLGFAKVIAPEKSQGSLITQPDGTVIGSRLIAQKFEKPHYFWPRPSAVDYNASGAGGSNKSPTSSDLTDRATKIVEAYEASLQKPLPAELAAAPGGGLDPHITEQGALYQASRVASARRVAVSEVEKIIRQQAFVPGGLFTAERLVNVLELNLTLDTVLQSME